MSNDFKPLQGMTDISNPDIFQWQKIEQIAHSVLTNFGYSELRTPILEKSDVFIHSLGNASDIVLKEMYNLEDRGGRSLVLRPEGTAGAIRFLASLGEEAYNNKIYYMGPMFRCERPQAGRKRQFHQIGVESINNPNPYIDAECIALQYEMLKKWGIENATIKINTLGSTDDQKNIREGLYSSLKKEIHNFPEDYQKRIK